MTRKSPVPDYLHKIVTPLKLQEALATHPDQTFAAFILRGIQYGFTIGFAAELVNLKLAKGT